MILHVDPTDLPTLVLPNGRILTFVDPADEDRLNRTYVKARQEKQLRGERDALLDEIIKTLKLLQGYSFSPERFLAVKVLLDQLANYATE